MSTFSLTAKRQLLSPYSENLTLAYKHLRFTEEGLELCSQLHEISNQLSQLINSNQLSLDNLKEITAKLLTINQQVQDKKVSERFEKIAKIMANLSGTALPPAPIPPAQPLAKCEPSNTASKKSQTVSKEQSEPVKTEDPALAQSEGQTAARIAKQNQRALTLMPKSNEPFIHYPYTPENKAAFSSSRAHSASPLSFAKTPGQDQIYSEEKTLSSSTVHVACAQGNRSYMEDRFLAVSLQFQANGKTCTADLFGVFDGHGGSQTVGFVVSSLVRFLQMQLEMRLENKMPNEEDIFFALREAVNQTHQGCMHRQLLGGTTAVFGFKLTDSNEIWTANVGDSSAFLDRHGEAIPMSIEQKPLYLYDASPNEAAPYSPNKYAVELLKRNVKVNDGKGLTEKELAHGEKMVMTSLGKDKDNNHHLVLGIPDKHHLDMSRSIGDAPFDKWKKHSPEIFRQTLQSGDLLVLHSDGVKASPPVVAAIFETEARNGTPTKETLEHLVQAAIKDNDNVCAMAVSFNACS
ncbi:MAG: protein serine/threonine phosphatase 2C family protein [Verrucomicrobia bacterium]|nr:protein serine/threonine phosphatase 2C family protein [Verrucomicrobiota bacterium]